MSLPIGLIVCTCSSFPCVICLFLIVSHYLWVSKLFVFPCSVQDCLCACLMLTYLPSGFPQCLPRFPVPDSPVFPSCSCLACASILLLTHLLLCPTALLHTPPASLPQPLDRIPSYNHCLFGRHASAIPVLVIDPCLSLTTSYLLCIALFACACSSNCGSARGSMIPYLSPNCIVIFLTIFQHNP